MTTYRLSAKIVNEKFSKREQFEGADDINKTILVRHIHGPNLQLCDPTDKKWRTYTNALITLDGYLYLDGDEPLPTYEKEMTISTG